MNTEIRSNNPVVKAIAAGTAPKPAQLAAARGILPLPQADLLEVLVILAGNQDQELSKAAEETLKSQDETQLKNAASSKETAPHILNYFATQNFLSKEISEAVIANPNTSANSIINLVRNTSDGELLEFVSFNQQLLIKTPAIIDAIAANQYRTAEADRRVTEIKREFFDKERGAEQIAKELKAQGKDAAAEFVESAEFFDGDGDIDDALFFAELIEVSDAEVDDSWLSLEYVEEIYEETDEQRQAATNKILGELKAENDGEIASERISMISRIMNMNIKDRVRMAMKGNREARSILIRDPNKIVAQAVIQNPKITEQEVEGITKMKTVPEDVLRQVAINRKWARNYVIFHNLSMNPRTPIGNAMNILPRLQLRDLIAMVKNKNVPDAIRKHAQRLSNARVGNR